MLFLFLLFSSLPASLGELSQLTYLNVGANFLGGPIPPSLSDLTNLKQLDLNSNSFSGQIPAGFFVSAQLPELSYLNVNNNHLTGPIPLVVGESPLKHLDLR